MPRTTVNLVGSCIVQRGHYAIPEIFKPNDMHRPGDDQSGFSGEGAPTTAAALSSPSGVPVDGAGNLVIADTVSQRIR